MKIDPELFEEWKAHPITELLIKALKAHAAECKSAWAEAAWVSGVCVPEDLLRKRERAATLLEVAEITPETIEEKLQ